MSRIKARSDLYEMDMLLDINIDLFPVAQGDKLSVCLATTLQKDGSQMAHDVRSKDDTYDVVRAKDVGGGEIERWTWVMPSGCRGCVHKIAWGGALSGLTRGRRLNRRLQGLAKRPSLMDKYDYVMYGRVFKYKDASSSGQTKADVRATTHAARPHARASGRPALSSLLLMLPPARPPARPQVFVSYGGLLMQLTGDPKRLEELDLDLNVYLLMRKV